MGKRTCLPVSLPSHTGNRVRLPMPRQSRQQFRHPKMRARGGDEKLLRHHLPSLLLIKIQRRRARVAPKLSDWPRLSQCFLRQSQQFRPDSTTAKFWSRRHPSQLIRRLVLPLIQMKRRTPHAFSIGKRRKMTRCRRLIALEYRRLTRQSLAKHDVPQVDNVRQLRQPNPH